MERCEEQCVPGLGADQLRRFEDITEIDVYTLQDAYTTLLDPTASMAFSAYGITDFDVQYWNGAAWVTVPVGSISGNRQVWRRIAFPAVTTDRIRVVVSLLHRHGSRRPTAIMAGVKTSA